MAWGDMFDDFQRLRREMDELFNRTAYWESTASFPLINLRGGKDEYILEAALPGMSKDSVEITILNGELSLSGSRKPLESAMNAAVMRKERPEGQFRKSFKLPDKIKEDGVRAEFQDGMLIVHLPKAEEVRPKQISIA